MSDSFLSSESMNFERSLSLLVCPISTAAWPTSQARTCESLVLDLESKYHNHRSTS